MKSYLIPWISSWWKNIRSKGKSIYSNTFQILIDFLVHNLTISYLIAYHSVENRKLNNFCLKLLSKRKLFLRDIREKISRGGGRRGRVLGVVLAKLYHASSDMYFIGRSPKHLHKTLNSHLQIFTWIFLKFSHQQAYTSMKCSYGRGGGL